MLALGIDPGTAICGYGLVKLQGNHLKAVKYGAIKTSLKLELAQRLAIIHHEIDALLKQFQPDLIGIEQLFFNKNVRTAMAVGQARGVVLLTAALNDVTIVEYTPLQVKQSVVGYGRATKDQVTLMAQRLLCLDCAPKPDDVADALAIAICSLHSSSLNKCWEQNQ